MPTPRENNIWTNIRVQLSSVQKELLDGKCNDAVLTSREMLKTLVRLQMDQACLVSTDLDGDIDQLFDNRIISTATKENYHAVSQIGAQVEQGASVNAQQANDVFSLIRQELSDYVEKNQRTQTRAAAAYEQDQEAGPEASLSKRYSTEDSTLDVPIRKRRTEESGERERVKLQKSSSGTARRSGSTSGRSSKSSRTTARSSGKKSSVRSSSQRRGSSGRRASEEPMEFDIYNVLKIAIPVVCVILIVILIRVLSSGGRSEIQTTAATTTVVEETTTQAVETEPETTEPETTETPRRWVTTTSGLRVRTRPSTEDSEVLTVLEDAGTELNFKSVYNDEWIAIDYNGQEAYVSSQYVTSEEIS